MKKLISVLLAVVLMLALCACGSGTANTPAAPSGGSEAAAKPEAKPETKKDPVVLKVALALPEETPFSYACEDLAKRISERTDGQYQLKVYYNSTLCEKSELFSMMSTGAIEMGESPIENMVDSDIRFGAISLPFAFSSVEASTKFANLINERLYNKILREKFNIMPLLAFSTGMQQYSGTKSGVATLDDWKGKLIWCSNTISSDAVTCLGAAPVILEFWDGYPALQKGTVDASVSNSSEGVAMFKWYDVVKHISICNMLSSSSALYICCDLFESFPEDVQQIFREECDAMVKQQADLAYNMEERVKAELEPLGVTYNVVSDSEIAAWREAVASVYDNFYAQMDPADAEIIQQCIEEANKTA